MSLLHLVSGQNLPNLLPLLALGPRPVIQLRSAETVFAKRADQLSSTLCDLHRWEASLLRETATPSRSPEIAEVHDTLTQIHRATSITWINFTGGTKLMSIAAHHFAREQRIPSFYVDTENSRWVDGQTAPWTEAFPSLTATIARLTVATVLSAHGIRPDTLRSEPIASEQLAFARLTAQLRQKDTKGEFSAFLAEARRRLHNSKGNFLEGGKLKAALVEGLPAAVGPLTDEWLEAARKAGLLREAGTVHRLAIDETLNSKKLLHRAKDLWRFLEGGWWELVVFDAMERSGRFLDLRWSVQSKQGDEDALPLGENDLMAIDRQRLAIVFVSCKATDDRVGPLEHVFQTRERAIRYGGTFAHLAFAFFASHKPQKKVQIVAAGEAARARVVFGLKELHDWLQLPPPDVADVG